MSAISPSIKITGNPNRKLSFGYFKDFSFDIEANIIKTNSISVTNEIITANDFYTIGDRLVSTVSEVQLSATNLRTYSNPEEVSFAYSAEPSDIVNMSDNILTINSSASSCIATVSVSAIKNEEAKNVIKKYYHLGRKSDFSIINDIGYQDVYDWIPGSLGYYFNESFFKNLEGKTKTDANVKVYSVQNHSSKIYERSDTFWAKDIDFTGVSPWNSDNSIRKAGTLVSPIHIIFAHHYPISNGSTIRFITKDNQVVQRTLVNSQRVGVTDIQVGILHEDVPSSIKFYKIIDFSDISNRLTFSSGLIPLIFFDFEEKGLVGFYRGGLNTVNIGLLNNLEFKYDSLYSSFYETPIPGDSGNPIFAILKGEAYLASTFLTSTSGPNIGYYKDDVNTVMSNLGGNYQLEILDLNEFPDISIYRSL